MNFEALISQIDNAHQILQKNEVKASYGTKLLAKLATSLKTKSIKTNERDFRTFRSFYNTYALFVDFLPFLSIYNSLPKSILPFHGSASSDPRIQKSDSGVNNPRI